MADLQVLVISTNPLARLGLVALLSSLSDCEVVGQSSGDSDLREQITRLEPSVLLWDLGWESASALDVLKALYTGDIRDNNMPPAVVLLSDEDDAAQAQSAGAAGLLTQGSLAEQLYAALLAVSEGLTVLDPMFSPALLSPRPPATPEEGLAEALTPRENEVLQLLALGLPNKIIAARLGVSEHTIKFHVNAIMTKLGAQSRTEAVVRATKLGLIIL
jgi:two-component system, NarL family, nitrate/nitrite response regulator NarL